MKRREKSVLNFAEAVDCGHLAVTFHTWQTNNHEQVLRRLAQLGVIWDGPPHSGERAIWLQGTLGPIQITVFLPLDLVVPLPFVTEQKLAA